jgi:hypothetical protein
MNRKTCLATIFVAVLCLMTSGCFNIEQEIFLEPDGSGDLVIFVSLPEIPEEMRKLVPGTQQGPQKLFDENKLDEIKRKLATDLPPDLKLKELKEVRRHGARAVYIVFHFNQLDDVDSMLNKVSDASLGETARALSTNSNDESVWKIQLNKSGDLTVVTQHLYIDFTDLLGGAMGAGKSESAKATSDSKTQVDPQASINEKSAPEPTSKGTESRTASGAKPAAPKEADPFKGDGPMDMLYDEKTMGMLASSILKMRFVLHAPRKITETNADIVLNGNIAIWNVSLGAFFTEKNPIEMKMTY